MPQSHYQGFLLGIKVLMQDKVDKQALGVRLEAGLGGQIPQSNLAIEPE